MRASSRVFMKAPLPTFTSSTSASAPSASFLERIEADDQRDALDRRRHVPERVELAIGGGDLLALADDRAAMALEGALESLEADAHV